MRLQLNMAAVFLAMKAQGIETVTSYTAQSIVDLANRYAGNEIWIDEAGTLFRLMPDDDLRWNPAPVEGTPVYPSRLPSYRLVGTDGEPLRDGEWPQALKDALTAHEAPMRELFSRS